MAMNPIQGIFSEIPRLQDIQKKQAPGFGEMLSSFVNEVNQEQVNTNQMVKDFAEGKQVELHEVMIQSEQAKTSLELLMEIRNKTIDMYKELTRIQI